jgi:hypothetical protein
VIRRTLSLLTATAAALAATLVPTGTASALGGEYLECEIGPAPFTWGVNCFPERIANPDDIVFQVFNKAGSGYSFSWTLEGRRTIIRGCGPTDDFCEATTHVASDHEVTATVVVSQNGSSETLSATAYIYAVCGKFWC